MNSKGTHRNILGQDDPSRPLEADEINSIKAFADPDTLLYIERLEAIANTGAELWRVHGSRDEALIRKADIEFGDAMSGIDWFSVEDAL